jgi:hypothetical protein
VCRAPIPRAPCDRRTGCCPTASESRAGSQREAARNDSGPALDLAAFPISTTSTSTVASRATVDDLRRSGSRVVVQHRGKDDALILGSHDEGRRSIRMGQPESVCGVEESTFGHQARIADTPNQLTAPTLQNCSYPTTSCGNEESGVGPTADDGHDRVDPDAGHRTVHVQWPGLAPDKGSCRHVNRRRVPYPLAKARHWAPKSAGNRHGASRACGLPPESLALALGAGARSYGGALTLPRAPARGFATQPGAAWPPA